MRRAFRLTLRRPHIEREVDDEILFHLEMRTQRLIAGGLSPDEARAEALRQFGDLTGVRSSCVTFDHQRERAMQRANLLDGLRQDVLYALRTLRNNPGFTAVVVLTLALGIGANTAIFSLVDALLLRPIPVREPERLVAIGDPSRVGAVSQGSPRTDLFSYRLYRELRERNRVVTGLLASGRGLRFDVRLSGETAGEPERPRARFVSGNYFEVLGVPTMLGRPFGAEEDGAPGASPVVVISESYWTRRFGGDRGVIGRSLSIDDVPVTIIGVTPPGFTGEVVGGSTDMWIPITMQPVLMPTRQWLDDQGTSWLLLLGRLRPGVTLEQARASFVPLTQQVIDELSTAAGRPEEGRRLRDDPAPVASGAKGFSGLRRDFFVPLLTLMAGVGLLLLIVCANVANLLLARAVGRTREMSVRVALGAARTRLVRQLLTESVLLAVLGAAAGLVVAWWGSKLLLALAADGSRAIPIETRLDVPVLTFTMAASMIAVALFGLVPALRASHVDLAATMRAHARTVGGGMGRRGPRLPYAKLLVASQVALSLLLLVGAGLLVRSLRTLQRADAGLDREHLLMVNVDARARDYSGARLASLLRELTGRFQRLPGVAAVTYSENGIFSGTESMTTLEAEGFTARADDDTVAYYDRIGPGYAHAIGARLLQGRDISASEVERAPVVAVINETMARFYFPGASPLGKRIRFDSVSAEIVGVVADVQDHDLRQEPVRRVYLPYLQGGEEPGTLNFSIRATGDPARLVPAVRREVAAVDAALRILEISPLEQLVRESLREARLVTRLTAGFGVVALLLAAVGLYGVMTYAITRRTGEIGLRVALGAQRSDVIRMVLIEALRVVALGVVIGLPISLAAVRLLDSQLHGVGAADPIAIAVALSVLTASAIVAALLPAARAARVAPLVALRQE